MNNTLSLSEALKPLPNMGKAQTIQITNDKGKPASVIQYDFMAALPKADGLWVENCINCHVPMRKVQVNNDVKLLGIPESARYRPQNFETWEQNPVVPNNNLWGCYSCHSVWTITMSTWVKVSLNGIQEIRMDNVKALIPELEEVPKVPFDPGVQTEGSTKCSECQAWRKVKDYSDTENIHVCPNCKTGQIVLKLNTEEPIQGE